MASAAGRGAETPLVVPALGSEVCPHRQIYSVLGVKQASPARPVVFSFRGFGISQNGQDSVFKCKAFNGIIEGHGYTLSSPLISFSEEVGRILGWKVPVLEEDSEDEECFSLDEKDLFSVGARASQGGEEETRPRVPEPRKKAKTASVEPLSLQKEGSKFDFPSEVLSSFSNREKGGLGLPDSRPFQGDLLTSSSARSARMDGAPIDASASSSRRGITKQQAAMACAHGGMHEALSP